jgi:Domain of unknown function (DUF1707)
VSADFSSAGEPPGPGASPGARASDADRDRVVDVLCAAAGDGRLTAGEFGERLEAALSSRTLGELAVLTADLAGGSGAATAQAKDVMRIDKHGGSVRRTGRWVVPRRLELRSSWCDVTLDFTNAVITHDTLRIDMNVRGGSLILLARPGTVVDASSLTVQHTYVTVGPSAWPGVPAILRVQLAGWPYVRRPDRGAVALTLAVTDAKSGAFSSPPG